MRSAFRFRSEYLRAKNIFCDKRVNTSEPFVRDATHCCLSPDADMLADLYRSTLVYYIQPDRHSSYNFTHLSAHTTSTQRRTPVTSLS
ncbi:unnamed protein product, partial [Brenthis ino]